MSHLTEGYLSGLNDNTDTADYSAKHSRKDELVQPLWQCPHAELGLTSTVALAALARVRQIAISKG
jgi:hypothetical protein